MNYSQQLDSLIQQLSQSGQRPRLLLHTCCAPCASYCLQYLQQYFQITALYYNPNIDTLAEYEKRSAELVRMTKEYYGDVSTKILPWDNQAFLKMSQGLEDCKEGGERCAKCYALRLDKTADIARAEGFDYFASTLSISPLKDSAKLNEIGQAISQKYGVKNLPNDFKKKDGYLKSTLLSKKYSLYRQNYCGCKFSKENLS